MLLFAVAGRAEDGGAAGRFSATVPIDATADSVVKAREMARLDGQRRALDEVVEGLGGPAAPDKLGKLSDQAITDLVASFSVADERMSAVRYVANYTFHFRQSGVRHLMDSAGISVVAAEPGASSGAAAPAPPAAPSAPKPPNPPSAVSPAAAADSQKPVILLPVYAADAGSTLWDDPNPWREAWNLQSALPGEAGFVVPLGDAGDMATIDARRASAGDAPALAAEARRNGGDETIVAIAEPHGPPSHPAAIDVTVRDYRAGQPAVSHSASVTAAPGEDSDSLWRRAAAATAADIANGWQDAPAAADAPTDRLTAVLPIAGLDDWVRARARLAAVPQVRSVSLIALSRQQATLAIDYTGGIERLKAGLAAISLALVQDDNAWRLARNAPDRAP